MVIDTSAIFAAITGEPDSSVYCNAITSAPLRLISAATLLETQIILVSRSGSHSIPILNDLIERAGIAVVPFDEPMAEAAFDAFRRYGKGQGHSAAQHHRLHGICARQDARPAPALQRQ